MKILHITVHTGGGIGSAFAGLGLCGQDQTILLLEHPIDSAALSKVEKEGFRIVITPEKQQIEYEMVQADVVIISWTHHPAMTKFLYDFPAIPVRSVLWCHVSGNYFPAIPHLFLRKFNQVLFATPYSLELPSVKHFEKKYIEEHFSVVYGLNDLEKYRNVQHQDTGKFVVGYVGTLGFCKLHPNFIDYCAAVDIPNIQFAMVGSPTTKAELLRAAQSRGIADKFLFYGQVDNVPELLAKMNVFGYLLNPQHFGATENALLEAMAAGLPAVALRQCVEQFIIKNCETGYLIDSANSYRDALWQLYSNPEAARNMGNNARTDVLNRFHIQDNRIRFLERCEKAMEYQKSIHQFHDFFGENPADYFLSCVDADKGCFMDNHAKDAGLIFHEPTKGSPRHYHSYFPQDNRLALWSSQLNK